MFDELVEYYIELPPTTSISNLLNTYHFLFTSKHYKLPFYPSDIDKCDSIDLLYIIEETEFYLQHTTLEDLPHFNIDYHKHKTTFLQHLLAIEYILEVEQHPKSYDVIDNIFRIRYSDLSKPASKLYDEDELCFSKDVCA
jgi:hypothetical protein